MKIAIVAGEQSGDELGAALMESLLSKDDSISFFGVGGEKMQALGLQSLFPQDRLAVMGFVEPFKRLPDLLDAKKTVINACLAEKPILFLGIDSPDFNLRIAKALKKKGIKTAHYVSPSVWAWRQGRIKTIKASIDLMLTLFPFEVEFYEKNHVNALCVGHPLADKLPIEPLDKKQVDLIRRDFGVDGDFKVVTLMPGSRRGEVGLMGDLFFNVAHACLKIQPDLEFIVPAANLDRMKQLEEMLLQRDESFRQHVHLVQGQAHHAMQISTTVLLASGTSSLEAMLLKKPMIVAYRLAKMTYLIAKRMVKIPYISLPNLIADEQLVPELIQEQANVENLTQCVLLQLKDENRNYLEQRFKELHKLLQQDASEKASIALLRLVAEPESSPVLKN